MLGAAPLVAVLAACGASEGGAGAEEPSAAGASASASVISQASQDPRGTSAASPLPSRANEPVAPSAVATGLEAPWSLTFVDGTALVSERDSAQILQFDTEGRVRMVATIDGVSPRGEGGLLGIAAHEGYLYVYSTAVEGNRIQRFELVTSAETADIGLAQPEILLDGIPSASYHNGGRIAFGPDGMLYATTGDAGNTGSSQDLNSLAGKILRIGPDGSVPTDNPFPGSYVYSYGHRNPQGVAWDEDGAMYASEFGQNTWDELNVIEAGANYGWPEVEGIGNRPGFVDPVQQWATSEASPSGMTIRDGSIWIANLRGERLRQIPLSDLASSTEYFVGEYGRIRDIITAPDGSLWFVTNNTDGRGSPGTDDDRIIRFVP